jgi:hypothetical protein
MNLDIFQPIPCPKCGGDGLFREKPCVLCGGPGRLYRKIGDGVVMGLDAKSDPEARGHVVHIPLFPHQPPTETTIEVRREYAVD